MPSLLTKEKDTSVSQAEERREGNPFGTGTKTIMRVADVVRGLRGWRVISGISDEFLENNAEKKHQFLEVVLGLASLHSCRLSVKLCVRRVDQRATCQPTRSCL